MDNESQNVKIAVKTVLLETKSEREAVDSQWQSLIPGHWAVGIVIDSERSMKLKEGDAVFLKRLPFEKERVSKCSSEIYVETQEKNLLKLTSGVADKHALMTEVFSICHTVLCQAKPQRGDYLLLYADDALGLFMAAVAKEMGLFCIYSDSNKERKMLAERLADKVLNNESSKQELLDITDAEGPNIIVDLTREPNRLDTMVQQISQAGRIVVFGNKESEDYYHMRTLSIKEGEIIGFHVDAGVELEEPLELSCYAGYLPLFENLLVCL